MTHEAHLTARGTRCLLSLSMQLFDVVYSTSRLSYAMPASSRTASLTRQFLIDREILLAVLGPGVVRGSLISFGYELLAKVDIVK